MHLAGLFHHARLHGRKSIIRSDQVLLHQVTAHVDKVCLAGHLTVSHVPARVQGDQLSVEPDPLKNRLKVSLLRCVESREGLVDPDACQWGGSGG